MWHFLKLCTHAHVQHTARIQLLGSVQHYVIVSSPGPLIATPANYRWQPGDKADYVNMYIYTYSCYLPHSHITYVYMSIGNVNPTTTWPQVLSVDTGLQVVGNLPSVSSCFIYVCTHYPTCNPAHATIGIAHIGLSQYDISNITTIIKIRTYSTHRSFNPTLGWDECVWVLAAWWEEVGKGLQYIEAR